MRPISLTAVRLPLGILQGSKPITVSILPSPPKRRYRINMFPLSIGSALDNALAVGLVPLGSLTAVKEISSAVLSLQAGHGGGLGPIRARVNDDTIPYPY
jgi:hypothetical protein